MIHRVRDGGGGKRLRSGGAVSLDGRMGGFGFGMRMAVPRRFSGWTLAVALGALASPALAQPVELDPDAAVETRAERAGTEPAVPAAEIVDDLRDAAPTGPVDAGTGAGAGAEATAVETVTPAPAPPFVVRSVEVSASAYLSPAEIDAVVGDLVGTRIAPANVGAVAARFNALYDARGIALAQALIERVDPGAGLVAVELLEARIGAVRPGGRLAREDYYRRRIGVGPGDLADNRVIQANLQRFSVTDGIVADARFVPGAERGRTDLAVEFAEPPKHTFTVSADTFGTPATGEYRARFGFTDASLTGVLDPLGLTLTVSEGSRALGASYARPVNALGSRVFASIEGERSVTLGATRVTAHSINGEVGLNHALVTEPRLRVLARGSALGFFDESILAGVRINDQVGGGAQAGLTLVHERPGLLVSYDQLVRHVVWDDRVLARTGLNTTHLAGGGTVIVRPADRVALSVRGGWQAAFGERAPSAYRTTIASPEIVRGYPTGLSAGDGFYWVRAQIEGDLPLGEARELGIRPFAFADVGQAFERAAGGSVAQDMLSSVGAGIAVRAWNRGTGEVFVSKPLRDANGFDAGDSVRVDARIALRF